MKNEGVESWRSAFYSFFTSVNNFVAMAIRKESFCDTIVLVELSQISLQHSLYHREEIV